MAFPTPDIYKYDYSADPTSTGLAEKLWAHWGSTAATGLLTFTSAPDNNDTVTIGTKTYTFQTTLTDVDGNVLIGVSATTARDNLVEAINLTAATGTLTFSGTPSDGDTITIGTKTYTFQDSLANVDGNVWIDSSATTARDNLVAALNLAAGAGTTYAASTTRQVEVYVVANAANMDATARRGGAPGKIATTKSATNLSWASATLVNGSGTTYATAMARHSSVSVVANAGNMDTTARRGGTDGNSIDTTESTATVRLSWGSGTLTGGVASLSSKFTAVGPTDSSGKGTGSFGFRLSPVNVTEIWEANYRLEGSQASPDASYGGFALDPGERISDSSDPFPTASSQWSDERRCTYRNAANTSDVIFILEWPDTFMILHESSNTNYLPYGCHVGKVHAPLLQSDLDLGLSGLAIMGYEPMVSDSSFANGWVASNSVSKFQVASETWELEIRLPTALPSDAINIGARTEPAPLLIGKAGQSRPIGVMKYCYYWSPTDFPKVRLADTGLTVRYMYIYPVTYSLGNFIIPWDNTTIP